MATCSIPVHLLKARQLKNGNILSKLPFELFRELMRMLDLILFESFCRSMLSFQEQFITRALEREVFNLQLNGNVRDVDYFADLHMWDDDSSDDE